MKEPLLLGKHFYGAVTVGERGQVVIPAEARKEKDIKPGDKLLVFGHPLERFEPSQSYPYPFAGMLIFVRAEILENLIEQLSSLISDLEAVPAEKA